MANLEVSVNIERVMDALSDKGFEDIYATHYDDESGRIMVLHDDHGQVAHGEVEELTRIIEQASDVADLWSGLDDAGMNRTAAVNRA